jgi:hypothetical protein
VGNRLVANRSDLDFDSASEVTTQRPRSIAFAFFFISSAKTHVKPQTHGSEDTAIGLNARIIEDVTENETVIA